MTLQEALDMDSTQFNAACEAARVDDTLFKPINADTETFAEAMDRFVNFSSTRETIKAIYGAGRAIP